MTRNLDHTFLSSDATILNAIEAIDRSQSHIALVVDAEKRLLGTITDGDVRRGLLRGVPLSAAVSTVMNPHPHVLREGDDRNAAIELMQKNICKQVPVLDAEGRVVALETLDEAVLSLRHENWVVLLAGGRGERLMPLTAERPKPMLLIGDQPILETIIENLKKQGFVNFFISINYMGAMIQSHFGDGSDRGVNIRYLVEDQPLGTAGPLSLLPERPQAPLIVMNGDILTTVDFAHLLEFHHQHRSIGTMCVCEYSVQVPFGVVDVEHHRILRIVEKPRQRFLVSAGIYVLEPPALGLVPREKRFDMPTLFERLVEDRQETCVFPIREYWTDIGQLDDFERANRDFHGLFNLSRADV